MEDDCEVARVCRQVVEVVVKVCGIAVVKKVMEEE